MSLPAIIFDFGNVLAYFDFERAMTKLGLQFGLDGRELLKRFRSAEYQPLHASFERGEMDAFEFSERFARLAHRPMDHTSFAAAWADIFTANDSIIPVVEALRARGHRLVLGSNTNSIHAHHFRQQFAATLANFDRLVLSFEIGVLKPNLEFYRSCAAAACRAAESCVFIDDLAENIAGARAAGMHGIVYSDTPSLLNELQCSAIIA